jgi:formate hydrogenlyase subunit 6/NADH:ubiquinone oxidoreductase subunit I
LTYFRDIWSGIYTSLVGLKLTLLHLLKAYKRRKPFYVSENQYFAQKNGLVTLQYPRETLPLPDNARYQLHNEIDDCIVCDKCAKVCPVDCIDIEVIKATEEIGKTSDGTSKRLYAATFDIDMAKCCFCGLCTTVCPTECLTMTHEYDYSVVTVQEMNFSFANLTPTQAQEKRNLLEVFLKKKELEKQNKELQKNVQNVSQGDDNQENTNKENINQESLEPKTKLTFKPKMKPVIPKKNDSLNNLENNSENNPDTNEF